MSGTRISRHGSGWQGWVGGVLLLMAAWLPSPARGQADPLPPLPPAKVEAPAASTSPEAGAAAPTEGGVIQAGCKSCGGTLLGGPVGVPPGDCGNPCGGPCYPGRKPCDCPCDAKTPVGRLFNGIYECICCPDPCYEPRWLAVANNAFFVDAARPVTQMRLQYDTGYRLPLPDRAEYFWARADGNGKGPRPPTINGQRRFEPELQYSDLNLYTEAATGSFGLFTELKYREIDPLVFQGASGFGDLVIGTKSLLLDCELIQFGFQFKTFLPTGNFTRGLGVGHVSLEPAFLTALRLTSDCYFQGELAYWFPIGGDQSYQGPILHYHVALNKVLWSCGKDQSIQLIGSAELSGWDIEGGAYTDPATGARRSAKDVGDIVNIGPGLRLVICDKIDFGVAGTWAVTSDSWAESLIRAEFRWRF